MQRITLFFWGFLIVFSALRNAPAQPAPGDVFREYYWYNSSGDAGQALRVGGKVGYGGTNITLRHDFDLENAVKAEVIVEKILCHDGTKGLSISINENEWIEIPEAETITYPQWNYQHHINPVVDVPLSIIKKGAGNVFRMKVSDEHPWNWPQNLINGVHFRIYYDTAVKPHPTGAVISPSPGEKIGDSVIIKTDAEGNGSEIKKVEFVGLYEDVNFEGDGVYYQWHYHFYHGKITNHIGTAASAPFQVTWDTSWVPDQPQTIQIVARIIDETGMITMTDAVDGLTLARENTSVELCKPYSVTPMWVTRKYNKREEFSVSGDIQKIIGAQLVWASWSPGYMNGIFINNNKVFNKEGPTYQYYAHRVTIDSLSVFQQGINYLVTGQTPLYNGKTVHGMEVQWPGIMVLLKYDTTPDAVDEGYSENVIPDCSLPLINYPNPFNGSTTIRYTLPESCAVKCRIISLSGQIVKTLVDAWQEAGIREVRWDGADNKGIVVGSGVYLCCLSFGGKRITNKILYMR